MLSVLSEAQAASIMALTLAPLTGLELTAILFPWVP